MKKLILWLLALSLNTVIWAGNGSSVHNITVDPDRMAELKKEVSKKKIIDISGQALKPMSLRGANSRYQLKGTTQGGSDVVVNIRVK